MEIGLERLLSKSTTGEETIYRPQAGDTGSRSEETHVTECHTESDTHGNVPM